MIALRKKTLTPIGIALGPRSVTMAQMVRELDQVSVHALAHEELDDSKLTSEADHLSAYSDLIRHMVGRYGFRGKQAIGCLGAQELFVQNVRIPQLPPDEVPKVVSWEAEERLPYEAAEAEIRHLMAGEVRQDSTTKQEIILLACQRAVIQSQIDLLEQSGLVPRAIDVEPCAVLRSLERLYVPDDDASRVAYLNLGLHSTSVMFADASRVLFLKYIPIGGNTFDEAVARDLDVTTSEASRVRALMKSATELDSEDEIHRSVTAAIRSSLETLSREIELCLRYFKVTFRGTPLREVVVTGAEATPWLLQFFSQRLGNNCVLGDPLQACGKSSRSQRQSESPWHWTTAIGLALH